LQHTTEARLAPQLPDMSARRALDRAAAFWFSTTVGGQLLFVLFILAFYYPSTLSGNFAAWNTKPLITGFVAADPAGNAAFGVHVVLAALITGAGLLQLVPALRRRWPAIHRWTGRIYLLTALSLALGGLWMVWVRGSYMNLPGAIGISTDAALILGCGTMALVHARRREIALHRRWALRTFIVASAVWFMRVGYMAWGVATSGAGVGQAMDGPFDLAIAFGNSLVPLAVLEAYLRVQDRGSIRSRYAMSGVLVICGLIIIGGSLAAWLIMWSPYL
jgi:uncharacterized membrane protein